MKAFLITANHEMQSCTVQVVDVRQRPFKYLPDVFEAEYEHINELLGASYFDLVRSPKGKLAKHCGFVDGEGLLESKDGYILCPDLYELPLAGPILLLGDAFHPQLGGISSAATVADSEVIALFSNAYVSRRYAKAAHDLAEQTMALEHPEVIVMRVSPEM